MTSMLLVDDESEDIKLEMIRQQKLEFMQRRQSKVSLRKSTLRRGRTSSKIQGESDQLSALPSAHSQVHLTSPWRKDNFSRLQSDFLMEKRLNIVERSEIEENDASPFDSSDFRNREDTQDFFDNQSVSQEPSSGRHLS
jgi:hypothetical protein